MVVQQHSSEQSPGTPHTMPSDGFTIRSRIRNLLRSPSTKHRSSRREAPSSQVTLDKVLGITASGNSGLACDPRSGLVAYPAGCVVVLLNPKNNRQHHIINTSRKTITALSFSPDGKYLVTGESGHLPAVRLWDVAERRQVAELQKHKYGISCVTFSPNSKYIVSVGNQHDMLVNVWAWKKDVVVAANKVSSKVTGVSFAEDSSYFVTVGNRHVKFWYLDHCKTNKASAPVPLLGRSGLLGDLRNNFFCDVACGRGSKADSTFCITSSGLLCEFNDKRMLDKWVDLWTGVAQSLSASEDLIFCGGADGTVRAFSAANLHFVCTLPRPHHLGSDVSAFTEASQLFSPKVDAKYPDAVAVTYDPVSRWLICVYHDHSLYVWDVRDVNRVGKVHSALYHAACVWDLEMFPDVSSQPGLPSGAFLSCSADNTIRVWRLEDSLQTSFQSSNILSTDLLNILYVDGNTTALLNSESTTNITADKSGDGQTAENRTGIRTICVSPDGKHLASGDRSGMLRVHDLSSMEEILKVEAHDAEILCLEYSKPDTGLKFLATASRDRLMHVLDADSDYSLVQTLDEHSSSITAVRFAANENKLRIISCGADKSIYFRTAHQTDRGTEFRRSHHTVRKTTLYDMSVDPSCKFAAVGCQDRCIRLFSISSGKQKKLYKGSLSEDGSLLRVQIDPSGQYVATSCSDKNISIFDFYTGECVATMFGHSEIVTGLKFTNDCRHLISVSGDSCIFVWRLAPALTMNMRERLCQLREEPDAPLHRTSSLRREIYSAPALAALSSDSDHEHEDDNAITSTDSSHGEEDTGGSDEGQDWELAEAGIVSPVIPDQSKRPRRRWSHRMGSLELMVKSMLDLRQLETFGHKKSLNSPPHTRDRGSMFNLQDPVSDEKARRRTAWLHSDWLSHSPRSVQGAEEVMVFPQEIEDSNYGMKRQLSRRGRDALHSESQDSCSPDSACSLGYDSRESSPDYFLDDSLNQDSSDEEAEEKKEKVQNVNVTSVDEALRAVTDDHSPEDFLKQNYEALADCSSTSEQSPVPRHSMSSRFLARGHNIRSVPVFGNPHGKDHDSPSAKPPVSKVRPLMEDIQGRSIEDKTSLATPGNKSSKADTDCIPILRPQKKKSSGPHAWRLSIPSAKASSPLDRAEGLQKAHSVQNLSTKTPLSPVTSSNRRQNLKQPQHLTLDHGPPSFQFSSPSTSSPLSSPQSPLPWDSSPAPKTQHSYMNPTASSMAKISRSYSVGEGLQVGTPPRSPCVPRGNAESEASILVSSPVTLPSSLSKIPSPTISQRALTIVPPSRIPLPKQQLSPRRCLVLEVKPCPSRSSTPTTDPACDAAPANKQVLSRHLSLEPPAQSLLPVKQKRSSVSEGVRQTEQVAAAKECPLLTEQASTSSAEMQQDQSITLETCRQAVSKLQDCLKRTIMFYSTIIARGPDLSEDQEQMKTVLSEALFSIKTELHSLPQLELQCEDHVVRAEGDPTMALLEQYAQLLLKSVEKKLDTKT